MLDVADSLLLRVRSHQLVIRSSGAVTTAKNGKGFNQIILRTGIKPRNSIRNIVQRREHDCGRRVFPGPQNREQRKPIAIRQTPVEKHDPIIGTKHGLDSLAEIKNVVDDNAPAGEILRARYAA